MSEVISKTNVFTTCNHHLSNNQISLIFKNNTVSFCSSLNVRANCLRASSDFLGKKMVVSEISRRQKYPSLIINAQVCRAATHDSPSPSSDAPKHEGIKEISVTMIKAVNNNTIESGRIDLTPWDLQLLLLEPVQKGFFYHKPSNFHHTDIITGLKNSLSRALDIFTPLAGRFAKTVHDDETVSYYLDCNNAGAQFVHAVADDVTLSDILEPVYTPKIVRSFFPLNGIQNYEGISNPLVGVQVTELIDGIFIGCTYNHVAGDGTTFWRFLKTWSQINRGLDLTNSEPLVLKRFFFEGVKPPIHFSLPQALPSFKKLQSGDNERISSLQALEERVFHFTKDSIANLKAKANAEMGTNRISSLQALLAHVWQAVSRNKNVESNEDVNFKLTMGARPRLRPELPGQYFGNAIQVGTVTMKAGELLEHGIGYAAMELNKLVAMHTEEKLKEYFVSWTENPKISTLDQPKNAVVVSSSPRFDVYANDFGWGKPIAPRSGLGNKYEGKITLFNGVEEGSVDIEVCLLPETIEGMGNDPEFMNAVSQK